MRPKNNITTTMIEIRNKYLFRISEMTGIPVDDVMGSRRLKGIVTARALLTWALTDLCGFTTTQTGVLIRRHYSSVIYLRKTLTTAIRLPRDIVAMMEDLKELNKKLKQNGQQEN